MYIIALATISLLTVGVDLIDLQNMRGLSESALSCQVPVLSKRGNIMRLPKYINSVTIKITQYKIFL